MSTNKGSFDTDAYGRIFSFVRCLKHFFRCLLFLNRRATPGELLRTTVW